MNHALSVRKHIPVVRANKTRNRRLTNNTLFYCWIKKVLIAKKFTTIVYVICYEKKWSNHPIEGKKKKIVEDAHILLKTHTKKRGKPLQKKEKNPPLKQLFEILRLILIVLWLNILKKYSAIILVLLAETTGIVI